MGRVRAELDESRARWRGAPHGAAASAMRISFSARSLAAASVRHFAENVSFRDDRRSANRDAERTGHDDVARLVIGDRGQFPIFRRVPRRELAVGFFAMCSRHAMSVRKI
jgi:hypothetical protein